ncbi:acyltransferase [Colletotrichum abscissum]|uniref:Tafazzin family protein n=2 Tax=Colletotrichum acutatum species complex TaxID=2707335 RepID=A0A9P9XC41_9PEZI|nr:acyltransferase [Colletotrichum abscissum]KAI3547195.1 acyltransferase [Colletotrichum abscissum]KAK1464400.1 acyltransferase [Colletotrichum cuscutae]KAK1525079.1 acyltransferase [Colletotrichum abscissum]
MTALEERPSEPSLPWRMASSAIMGLTGAISRAFLYTFHDVQTENQARFLEVLDKRRAETPERGLITVSNHISVLDDPLIWGVLPLKYNMYPLSARWGLGAHDICFKNRAFKTFFTLGQVLPTYRLLHSPYGGLFQPTMTQAIRLVSGPGALFPFKAAFEAGNNEVFSAPTYYRSKHGAWVHVFPEGCTHQNPERTLRYFKWGVSRLILESDPAPQLVPMFIDGFSDIMPEDRKWLRFLPRIGAKIRVFYGEALEVGEAFREQRLKWKRIVQKEVEARGKPLSVGEVPESLKDHPEAIQLRVEVAKTVRDMVQELRISAGYPRDSPAFALAETWEREPEDKQFKSPVDDSLVNKE